MIERVALYIDMTSAVDWLKLRDLVDHHQLRKIACIVEQTEKQQFLMKVYVYVADIFIEISTLEQVSTRRQREMETL